MNLSKIYNNIGNETIIPIYCINNFNVSLKSIGALKVTFKTFVGMEIFTIFVLDTYVYI